MAHLLNSRILVHREPSEMNATNYRTLRFESIEDCIAEILRIVEAEQENRLNATGNWTPGQILGHIAAWIEYGYEGYPIQAPPWIIRWILRMSLRRILTKGMSKGVRIPGIEGGTTGIQDMPVGEAASRLLNALDRLNRNELAQHESPAFGSMSHEDRVRLNLRHAELHLGFLNY